MARELTGEGFNLYQQERVSKQPPYIAGHTVEATIPGRPKTHHGVAPPGLNIVLFCFFRMMLRACTARSRSIGQVHPVKHSKSQNQKKEGLRKNKSHFRSIYWADGYVLVFSITDHNSYRTIQPLYQHVRRIHPSGNIPVILVSVCNDNQENVDDCIFTFAATFNGSPLTSFQRITSRHSLSEDNGHLLTLIPIG